MKVYVYRLQSKGGMKCRFSDKLFIDGFVQGGAKYFSTYATENPEHDALCEFLIKHFNIPYNSNFEIEL